MKMRELEKRTGVSRQMVQFYLAHGLLPEPVRPKANVAEYSEEHVRAIEVIRRLQTEGRLKIQEIKQALAGGPASAPTEVAVIPHLDRLFALRAGVDTQLVPLSSIESRNPKAKTDAVVLQQIGAIEIVRRDGQSQVSRMDAQIVGLWGDMRAAGFTEERGFDPNIVTMYLKAARDIAAAEIDLFAAHVSRDLPVEQRAAMAETASKLMLGVFTVLRMKAEVEAFARVEQAAKGEQPTKNDRAAHAETAPA
ncbi:MAG: MerR family regulatory protein [Panacagrimonas sp.]|jgi:DNA-binding transcriptional MerR regulator|nr:MerR family transcriptional regulator [Panacagrimonas sp.]MCC2658418.1 MerR family regulatory protein [Panacagrimonas sp.]